ncbi:MAG: hypothetical protein QGF67_11415 [Lentisphaeria bacterium]|jgi:hypothetical protein|nr:hypothetical protein [Lentisphaeria bacterium]MDP7742043.1 hypothetical protein [Lentisphaeria bacterium]
MTYVLAGIRKQIDRGQELLAMFEDENRHCTSANMIEPEDVVEIMRKRSARVISFDNDRKQDADAVLDALLTAEQLERPQLLADLRSMIENMLTSDRKNEMLITRLLLTKPPKHN